MQRSLYLFTASVIIAVKLIWYTQNNEYMLQEMFLFFDRNIIYVTIKLYKLVVYSRL
jgi:hypothetical protein